MSYRLKKVDENIYEDQLGVNYESPTEWLWIGIMGGCGCGDAKDLADKALDVLRYFATPHSQRLLSIYDTPSKEVIAHWMSSLDMIEHGTGIGGGWLTPKGNEILEEIERELVND